MYTLAISRLFKKINRIICFLIGIDEITHLKIKKLNNLKLVGSKHAGWVIPLGVLNTNSVCYCAGCGEDISFDLGLIDLFNCRVYGFDPTPRAIKHVQLAAKNYDKYIFTDVGLWDHETILRFYAPQNPQNVSYSALNLQKTKDFFEAKVKRLSQIMLENDNKHCDLLKLDIEGAEYKVIDSIIKDNLAIGILLVEFDEYSSPLDNKFKQRITQSIQEVIDNDYSLVFAYTGNYTFIKNGIYNTLKFGS